MNKLLLATVSLLAFPWSGVAHAAAGGTATRAEVAALQAQMQAMAERLDRLEAANAQLLGQNAELRTLADRRGAEFDDLKTQSQELKTAVATTADDLGKLAGADWASRVRFRGDLRYRHERIDQERDVDGEAQEAADREGDRVRARFGLDAAVTRTVKTTLLLSTGGDDPRGTNQTLGGESSRKQIGLDLAYASWRFRPGHELVLGKQTYPIWRPVNTLFFDSDVNPEGAALRVARGAVFANLYGYWLTEQYTADPSGENSDARMFGLQAGVTLPLFGGETTLAAHYYDCGACRDHAPFYAGNAYGNTTYLSGTGSVLRYDYDVLDLDAQVGTKVGGLPLTFVATFARNLASGVEYDTAWSAGAFLGRAAEPHSWEIGALYQSVDKDAQFGQVVDSEFAKGLTDGAGWMLKAGYAPVRNITLATQIYLNTLSKDVGTELDFSRLQLDVNYRF